MKVCMNCGHTAPSYEKACSNCGDLLPVSPEKTFTFTLPELEELAGRIWDACSKTFEDRYGLYNDSPDKQTFITQ